MAIRLSLHLTGATCGELLRFADTLRSTRVPAGQPIERSGPDHIEVSVTGAQPGSPGPESYGSHGSYGSYGYESYGPESYGRPPESYGPVPADRPPGPPGSGRPPFGPGRPPFGPPRAVGPWPGHAPPPYSGVPVSPGGPTHFAAHFGAHHPHFGAPPRQGAHLNVRQGDREIVTDVSSETVEKWKTALTEALESTGLSETARGPLLELRAILSLEEFPRRGQ
jgi:hypothetical protein